VTRRNQNNIEKAKSGYIRGEAMVNKVWSWRKRKRRKSGESGPIKGSNRGAFTF
jgi:hypothetical protein